MKVKAADGVRVPMEHRAHDYIEQMPVEVPDTLYYRRLIADGDLHAVAAGKTKEGAEQ